MQIPILSHYHSLSDSQEYDVETKLESLDRKSTLEDSIYQCHSPCILPINLTRLSLSSANVYRSAKYYKEETLIDRSSMCVEHMKYYAYSCKTCEENICSDCMSNPAKHRGHRFQKYNQKKEELRLLRGQISAKLNFKKQSTQQIALNLEKRYENRESVKIEKRIKLQNHIERLKKIKELSKQIQEQQYQISKNRAAIKEQNNFYQSCLKQLTQSSKIKIISQIGSKIENQLARHIYYVHQIQPKFIKMENISITNPQPLQTFFNLHHFTQHKSQKKQILLETFHAFHNSWRLKVYPAGFTGQNTNQHQNQKPYLSIYIQRLTGILPTAKFTIQIEIKSKLNPNLVINKQFQPEFTHNQSWGYDKYTRISNIYEHGFLGNDDTLTIRLQISPINYQQTIETVSLVIQNKQSQMEKNQQRIRLLKEKLFRKNQEKQKENLKQDSKSITTNEFYQQQLLSPNQYNTKEPEDQSSCKYLSESQTQKPSGIEHPSQSQTQWFSPTLKQEIKSKLSNQICELGIKKIKKIKYGQTFLDESSPRRLIRLVSSQNAELAQHCKKRVYSRSNTHE